MRSNPVWHLYRRVECLFGADDFKSRFRNLRVTYETPDAIARAALPARWHWPARLPGQLTDYMAAIETGILRRFAWADGISARLSDVYRGGMTLNFLLAPLAIVGGIAYLTFATSEQKWLFALFELTLLAAVLGHHADGPEASLAPALVRDAPRGRIPAACAHTAIVRRRARAGSLAHGNGNFLARVVRASCTARGRAAATGHHAALPARAP